ncbi:hypothetical protein [Bacteroides sp. 51]|uniref:hypothetical protein n=1 Tax=Bacteroides sp. 51 TaxID=2302938 RepID=UPI0019403976|nr:hypothetical protein [Bacteroides sp. 51]
MNFKPLFPLFLFTFSLFIHSTHAQRWTIQPDHSIKWAVTDDIPHYDHIEMSGLKVSAVLRYGVNADGSFSLERSMIWPMLRTIPNNTHGSLMQRSSIDYLSMLIVNGKTLNNEKVKSLKLDGTLTVVSEFTIDHTRGHIGNKLQEPAVEVTRVYFPSTDEPMLCEEYTVKNISDRPVSLLIPQSRVIYQTDPAKGVDGSYRIVGTLISPLMDTLTGVSMSTLKETSTEPITLGSGETVRFGATLQANNSDETELFPDLTAERKARESFVHQIQTNLCFESPDEVINHAFAFAKVRTAESIFATSGGLMHGPGGESYYAAVWANDQAEYVNPFFPFLGYATGNESALNSFRHFARFMNPEYKPMPSSIVAEGKDVWHGAGDRGDAAMIAYGAARYALAKGDAAEANTLWPLIEWCLEYCNRQLTAEGVVASDSDELENRFPSGDANLCTSTLYYDALLSAVFLAKELKKPVGQVKQYARRAEDLKEAINRHFGATVEGFETYRYYDGNDVLRSWICMPLTVGIYERSEGTVNALFSPRLWTKDGLLTQAGTSTFWDRSTLYALRGVFAAGETEKALDYLHDYSAQRLLGEHVPYPIEAWPEGNQRHLSAESGLYARIVTEGLFGIRPTGFRSFTLTPQLPDKWDRMALKNIQAFGDAPFDIFVERRGSKIETRLQRNNRVIKTYRIRNGESVRVRL